MKTFKLITCIVLFCACSSFAQVTPGTEPTPVPVKPAESLNQDMHTTQGQQPMVAGQSAARMNRFMVQVPHTKDQCETIKKQMQEKGSPVMMRFDWSCASGEHNGYALMGGQSEDAVRKQLPEGIQKVAKVVKVDKLNAAQMEQMHK